MFYKKEIREDSYGHAFYSAILNHWLSQPIGVLMRGGGRQGAFVSLYRTALSALCSSLAVHLLLAISLPGSIRNKKMTPILHQKASLTFNLKDPFKSIVSYYFLAEATIVRQKVHAKDYTW